MATIDLFENIEGAAEPNFKEVFACGTPQNFIDHIVTALPYSGYSDSKFYICEVDNAEYLTKLSFYKKSNPEIYNAAPANVTNPCDTEIKILKILNQHFADANVTPCIIAVLHANRCKLKQPTFTTHTPHTKLIADAFSKQQDLVDRGLASPYYSFTVLEECDINILTFINHMIDGSTVDNAVFVSLIFQLIYTLHVIAAKYPLFRHNDLHGDNVMLKFEHEFDPTVPRFLMFNDGTTKFYVPYFGVIVKIIDFGFASIPEQKVVSAVTLDPTIMFSRPDNDLLFFMSDVYGSSNKKKSVERLFDKIAPAAYKATTAGELRKAAATFPSYKTICSKPVFDAYRKPVGPAMIFAKFDPP